MTQPLKRITEQAINPSGPRHGMQLWFTLECGHTTIRTLKARYNDLTRIRCPFCPPKESHPHGS